MIDARRALTLLACCCGCLSVATSAMADFVGVVTENNTDVDTVFLCGAANGEFVPLPLTVCKVSIQFGDDNDRLLSIGFADLQVMNGASPDVFHHQPFGGPHGGPYACSLLSIFPDLICDSYFAIGEKCVGLGGATRDGDFLLDEFNNNGHIVGGWFNNSHLNGLGEAFNHINPDGKVLILQSAVAVGLSLEGSATIFWQNLGDPTVFEEPVEIVCEATCPGGQPCDDGDACTENDTCGPDGCVEGTPIDCDDGNDCTDDSCDPDSGCQHTPNDGPCDDGDACTADDACSGGECIGGRPIDCDDDDACTEDSCDFDAGGCVSTPIDCPEGQACDPDTGQCVAVPVGFLDIIPGKCPNRLQRNGLGFLKVSLVSATEADGGPFDACDVDVSTIQLCRADGTAGCAQPTSNPAPRCRDQATPFLGELCDCHSRRKDGLDDLDMRFKVADVVNNLGLSEMPAGVSVELELTALSNDGQNIKAGDCVELGRDLGPNP